MAPHLASAVCIAAALFSHSARGGSYRRTYIPRALLGLDAPAPREQKRLSRARSGGGAVQGTAEERPFAHLLRHMSSWQSRADVGPAWMRAPRPAWLDPPQKQNGAAPRGTLPLFAQWWTELQARAARRDGLIDGDLVWVALPGLPAWPAVVVRPLKGLVRPLKRKVSEKEKGPSQERGGRSMVLLGTLEPWSARGATLTPYTRFLAEHLPLLEPIPGEEAVRAEAPLEGLSRWGSSDALAKALLHRSLGHQGTAREHTGAANGTSGGAGARWGVGDMESGLSAAFARAVGEAMYLHGEKRRAEGLDLDGAANTSQSIPAGRDAMRIMDGRSRADGAPHSQPRPAPVGSDGAAGFRVEAHQNALWISRGGAGPRKHGAARCACGADAVKGHDKTVRHRDHQRFLAILNSSNVTDLGANSTLLASGFGERFANTGLGVSGRRAEDHQGAEDDGVGLPGARSEGRGEIEALAAVAAALAEPVESAAWERERQAFVAERRREEMARGTPGDLAAAVTASPNGTKTARAHDSLDSSNSPTSSNSSSGSNSSNLTGAPDAVLAAAGGTGETPSETIGAFRRLASGETCEGASAGASGSESAAVSFGCRLCQVVSPTVGALRRHAMLRGHTIRALWHAAGWISANGTRTASFPDSKRKMWLEVRKMRYHAGASVSNRHCARCRKLGLVVRCDCCPRVLHLSCIPPETPAPSSALRRDPWSCDRCVLRDSSLKRERRQGRSVRRGERDEARIKRRLMTQAQRRAEAEERRLVRAEQQRKRRREERRIRDLLAPVARLSREELAARAARTDDALREVTLPDGRRVPAVSVPAPLGDPLPLPTDILSAVLSTGAFLARFSRHTVPQPPVAADLGVVQLARLEVSGGASAGTLEALAEWLVRLAARGRGHELMRWKDNTTGVEDEGGMQDERGEAEEDAGAGEGEGEGEGEGQDEGQDEREGGGEGQDEGRGEGEGEDGTGENGGKSKTALSESPEVFSPRHVGEAVQLEDTAATGQTWVSEAPWEEIGAALVRKSIAAQDAWELGNLLEEKAAAREGGGEPEPWLATELWRVLAFVCDEACAGDAVRAVVNRLVEEEEEEGRRQRQAARERRAVIALHASRAVPGLPPDLAGAFV